MAFMCPRQAPRTGSGGRPCSFDIGTALSGISEPRTPSTRLDLDIAGGGLQRHAIAAITPLRQPNHEYLLKLAELSVVSAKVNIQTYTQGSVVHNAGVCLCNRIRWFS